MKDPRPAAFQESEVLEFGALARRVGFFEIWDDDSWRGLENELVEDIEGDDKPHDPGHKSRPRYRAIRFRIV